MNLGKENHDGITDEQILIKENDILIREYKRLRYEKAKLQEEKAILQKEKATLENEKGGALSREAQCPMKEGCWTSDKEKELENLKDQLDKLQQAMVTLLTADKAKRDETSKLQERIIQIQRDFEKKANAFDRLSGEMREKKEEISHLLQEKDRVLQISERLKEKEKNDKLLQEHICKLRNELQEKQKKVEDLSQKLDEGTKDIERLNNSLQTNEQERMKREKMLNNDIDTMNKEMEILREKITEKDSNLSQLSKLTEGNLSITDRCKPNRPAEIGERWASLYSDEWTDVFEEMIQKNEKMGKEDEIPEKQLLKIVDWCYTKCTEIFNSQNTLLDEKVWELVSILHRSGVKEIPLKKNQRINAYEQKGKESTVLMQASESFLQNAKEQQQCSSALVDSVKKKCSDDYGLLNKTTSGREKEFVRKCSELCWYMICSDPPMAIEYENIENKAMDSIKFNKYNRTGRIVEYVVWPVLLLHSDGPVLAKGSVQTRQNSVENFIAPPLACRAISSDDHVSISNQTTNNNTKCAEFMKSEENVVKMIDDDKYNANFLLQSRRRHLLKSQCMIEEHDREPKERDVTNCDNKTKRLNGINRTVSTSFLGESISRNNAKMFNTKYYGKPENLVERMPRNTDILKRTFDKAAERSKIPQQFTKGKEQSKE